MTLLSAIMQIFNTPKLAKNPEHRIGVRGFSRKNFVPGDGLEKEPSAARNVGLSAAFQAGRAVVRLQDDGLREFRETVHGSGHRVDDKVGGEGGDALRRYPVTTQVVCEGGGAGGGAVGERDAAAEAQRGYRRGAAGAAAADDERLLEEIPGRAGNDGLGVRGGEPGERLAHGEDDAGHVGVVADDAGGGLDGEVHGAAQARVVRQRVHGAECEFLEGRRDVDAGVLVQEALPGRAEIGAFDQVVRIASPVSRFKELGAERSRDGMSDKSEPFHRRKKVSWM